MATTTNFGWETPDDTDLVKDGALAMRTLGNAIDASLVDLKGGTTGQVLSKTSNTDMDFTWVTSDDANAIQNAIVDAKGDLISASAADTPARLAVGNNGETLVADSSASTGLRWQGSYEAGKNKFINGNFDIWQRGTSFTNPANLTFTADRIGIYFDGAGATRTVSRQSNLEVIGSSTPNYFIRFNQSVAGSGAANNLWYTRLEDVSTLAGQTVTVSFYAKAAASTVMPQISFDQNFGSGGSSSVVTTVATNVTVGTSWTRYSYTVSLPSITGKTVGASNYLALEVRMPLNATFTLDFSQFQIEAGNTATAFQTATGTLAGELAAACRYFQVFNSQQNIGWAGAASTTSVSRFFFSAPNMRTVNPTITLVGTPQLFDGVNQINITSTSSIGTPSQMGFHANINVASGLTQYRPYTIYANGGEIQISAEL